MYWALQGTDPYNRIGKTALQDIYGWAKEGFLSYKIIFGPRPDLDLIRITRGRTWRTT